MADFKAGFCRVDVTPPLGTEIAGYFFERYAEGVLDNLEANTLAVSCNGVTAVIIALDNLHINQIQMDIYRNQIAKAAGIPYSAVFIACTHTHTGPQVGKDSLREVYDNELYTESLGVKLADSAVMAIKDMKPAKLGYAVGQAPRIAFVRRFRMKDGSVRTNPGINNPDIDHPLGDVDERVNVIRIVREEGPEIVIANFGVHPDTVGGSLISADYPRFVRETTERVLDNVKCMFLNGAEGDVNHTNVHPTGGDHNGLAPVHDDGDRGYEHTKHMGRTIAGAILQVYAKVNFTEPDAVAAIHRPVEAPSNMPNPEDLPRAREIVQLNIEGRDKELPYEGMELTTVVAEAVRMVRLEHGPESFTLNLTGIRMGDVAFVGIPGEPFTAIGRGIKAGSPFAVTCPCCLTNGAEGYYPSQDAYDEGGYEARSSRFKSGIAELLTNESIALLNDLKKA